MRKYTVKKEKKVETIKLDFDYQNEKIKTKKRSSNINWPKEILEYNNEFTDSSNQEEKDIFIDGELLDED